MDEYDYRCLYSDFLHVHEMHMLNHDEMQRRICSALAERYGCAYNKETCNVSRRHLAHHGHREGATLTKSTSATPMASSSDKDVMWVSKLDHIHHYVLQFRSVIHYYYFRNRKERGLVGSGKC